MAKLSEIIANRTKLLNMLEKCNFHLHFISSTQMSGVQLPITPPPWRSLNTAMEGSRADLPLTEQLGDFPSIKVCK